MSKESKILIGVGLLAVIGLVLALGGHMAIGLIVLAVGLVAGFAGLRLTQADTDDPFAEVRSEADRTSTGTLTANEPLAPWSPEGGLTAWTPPAPTAPPEAVAPVAPPAPSYPEPAPVEPAVAEPSAWDDTSWDSTVTWEADDEIAPAAPAAASFTAPPLDTNPLDDLAGLDALDPIAEVERIESRAAEPEVVSDDGFTGFTPFDSAGNGTSVPFVNENVSGADDIMAASQATELDSSVAGEQTELQKLLAKVQIRLSAYE